jgi:hypothetical protein
VHVHVLARSSSSAISRATYRTQWINRSRALITLATSVAGRPNASAISAGLSIARPMQSSTWSENPIVFPGEPLLHERRAPRARVDRDDHVLGRPATVTAGSLTLAGSTSAGAVIDLER